MDYYLDTQRLPVARYSIFAPTDFTVDRKPKSCPHSWVTEVLNPDQKLSPRALKERLNRISGSDNLKQCLKFACNADVSATSRENGAIRAEQVTQPQMTRYRRGFKHLPEIGNFSNYNAVIRRNKNAILNR